MSILPRPGNVPGLIAVFVLGAFATVASAQFAQPGRQGPQPQAPSKLPTPKTDIDARAPEKAVPEPAPLRARPADNSVLLDRVIAIVNDEALTQYDINEQTRTIVAEPLSVTRVEFLFGASEVSQTLSDGTSRDTSRDASP